MVQKALRPVRGGTPSNPDCMASVVDVWVSGDLQVAKIQISLYNAKGDDMSSRFEKLENLTGYRIHNLSSIICLILTPTLDSLLGFL